MLLHAGAYASRAKLIEKIEEHRLSYLAMGPTWNHETDFVQPRRRVRNASRSNIITSCSYLRSAPCNGGSVFLGSRDCSTSNGMSCASKIGREHVCTPVTNAQLVCRILLEKT